MAPSSSLLPIPEQGRFRPDWAALFACAGLLAASACAPLQVRLGRKVYLDQTPVVSMAASLPGGPGIAPGEKLPLVAVFTGPGGEILTTEGAGKGKVLWKDITVAASVVAANQKGTLSLPADLRVSDGKVGHVLLTVPSHPDLHAELDIPVRYDYSFSANFAGSSGSNGHDGSNGSDGLSGSMGSIDPISPSPGGNGTDGSNGSDGGGGEPGGNGPDVQVLVALKSGNHPLLQVRVSAGRDERLYLVDPEGGSLTVTSEGGPGGSGGKGGQGGRGGSGGTGMPNGNSGHDGMSGSSGSGGAIAVTYDPKVQPFLRAIQLSNPGGPSPKFKQEPVAPLLWAPLVNAARPDPSFQGRVQNPIREPSDPSPSA
jgi:hypothetical protein